MTAREMPRPVTLNDVMTMVARVGDAARDRAYLVADGQLGTEYDQACRLHVWRELAVQRLVAALCRQGHR